MLKTLLKEKGLKQANLAKKVGVSQALVSYWSTNRSRPSYESLILLAKEIGVPVEEIINSFLEIS